ncbi:aminotransferase class IV [Priestia koreensis]|uniref:aminotransferase class IV n=1 Tax=Priestia koreensis TaxID=284581 RepID=UPI003CFC0060
MELAYYDGRFISINEKVIPIEERGHQFGDGVYEFIRVYDGRPFLLTEHLERLERSSQEILLTPSLSKEEITAIVEEGLQRTCLLEAEIYMQFTRGIAPRNHLFPHVPSQFSMTIRQAKVIPSEKRSGVAVLTLEDERWKNCYIKSLNLLPNLLAKQRAVSQGFEEAILVKDGFITEGSSSNVFVVKHGTLYTTPATNRILHGITRAAVLECADRVNVPVQEKDMSIDFFLDADEAFFTSTSVELMPISRINDTSLPHERPITASLHSAYKKLYAKKISF